MTETTTKGWVLVGKDSGTIMSYTFSIDRDQTIDRYDRGKTPSELVIKWYRVVKATMTIRLEEE